MKQFLFFCLAAMVCVSAQAQTSPLRVGILTNGASDFWTALQEAAQKEAEAQGVVLDFQVPSPATAEQQQRLALQMLDNGAKALALCPVKPKEQRDFLTEISSKTALATLITDAPGTGRRVFLGRDEKEVGALFSALLKTAIPEGLKVMAFCGKPDDKATKARLEGLQEALQDTFYLEGPKADFGDRMLVAANAADILQKRPEIACLIGLENYQAPMLASAVTQSGRARIVRVIGFGQTAQLLQQIKEGIVHGLVIDNGKGAAPVVLTALKALAAGDPAFVIPENECIYTPVTTVKTEKALGAQEMIDALTTQVPGIPETTPGRP